MENIKAYRPLLHIGLLFVICMVFIISVPSPLEAAESAPPQKQAAATTPLWKLEPLTLEAVQEAQKATEEELEAIPSDSPKDGIEGRKRSLLKKRLEQLAELQKILSRIWQMEEHAKGLKQRRTDLMKKLKKEKNRAAPKVPVNPTLEKFEVIKESLALKGDEIKAITEEFANRSNLMQQIPQNIMKAKQRRQEAEEEAQKLETLKQESEGVEGQLLQQQVTNIQLETRIAQEAIRRWEEEQEDEKNASPLRELALELARLQYENTEQRFALYQEGLKKSQKEALKVAEDKLAEKEKAVQSAETPEERALAIWESAVARLQNNIADLNQAKTNLLSKISDQEKLLNSEKDDLESLKNLVNQVGSSGPAAEILKTSFRRVGQRRQELSAVLDAEFQQQQGAYQARRIELDSQLLELRETWLQDFAAPLANLEGAEKRRFERKSNALLENRRALLRSEKHLIFDLISDGQRLMLLPLEREEALDELESFVLSRVFWIQDEPPVDLSMLTKLFSEIAGPGRPNSLWNWWKQVLSIETIASIARILTSWTAIIYGVLIFFVIPATLYLLRKRLYRFVGEQNRRGRENTLDLESLLPTIMAWVGGSMLNPLFFLLAAPMLSTLDLPVSLGPILSSFLVYFSLFMFIWLLSRSFFSTQGVAVSLFGVSPAVAKQFLVSIRLILITYLACLVPWIIFQGEPFQFEAFPRIGYLLFEAGVFMAIYLLIRPGSALIKQIFSHSQLPDAKPSRHERYWAAVSRIAAAVMAAILILDGAGYHFGATYLSVNGLWSLVTILGLAAISRTSTMALRRITSRSKTKAYRADDNAADKISMLSNLLKLWQLFIYVLGAYLLAQFWGLNESALKALTDSALFQTTNADGQVMFITAADLLTAMAIIFAMIWVLRHLTGLYETVLFPFVAFDEGLRYAIVTISRYLIFLIGTIWTPTALQMDLSKVGWAVAAMSVGLGFGLQEIVANFVSGIILLIERPIRVGDMVSIGTDLYGQVTQVNIRSTTVLSRDRQEILVPNKDLISKEVINWTLTDPVIREKVTIGVAYGSDVELVRSTLLEIAANDPDVLADPPSRALFLLHGESSLDFELRVFLNDPLLRRTVVDRINTAINREFTRLGIEIPFPQRDLHIIPQESRDEAAQVAPVL